MVCCHVESDWYESSPPRARWSLRSCMARSFEAAVAGVCVALILCVNQSSRSKIGGRRGCHKFVPVLGWDKSKVASRGDLCDQPPGEMS